MALKQLNLIVHRQGVVMAFADVFLLLTFLFVALGRARASDEASACGACTWRWPLRRRTKHVTGHAFAAAA